jgi:PAS domain S-box-containing protein
MQKKISHLAQMALLGLCYYGAARFGLAFAVDQTYVSPIWPASGVALAGLLLGGWELWPGIWLGSFVANFLYHHGTPEVLVSSRLQDSALIASASSLLAIACVCLATRWAGHRSGEFWRGPLFSKLSVLRFNAIAFGACLTSATVGATVSCAEQPGKWWEFVPLWFTWWLGDFAGITIVCPLVLAWSRRPPKGTYSKREVVEIFWSFGLLLLICWVVFVGFPNTLEMPMAFFAVGPLAWIALRSGAHCTHVALFLVYGFAAWHLAHPFPVSNPLEIPGTNHSILHLASLIMMAVVAHALESDSTARRKAEALYKDLASSLEHRVLERTAELEMSYERYRLVTANLPNSDVFLFDRSLRYLFAEGSTLERYGIRKDSLIGKNIWEAFPPEIATSLEPHYRAALEGQSELFEVSCEKGVNFLVSTVPIRDPRRQVTSGMAIAMDITPQRRAEAALRQSQQFTQGTIDALLANLCVIDKKGTILSVNRSWREFALANPPVPKNYLEGANYLEVCDKAAANHCPEAGPFARGIRAIIAGECVEFSMEYPCHSPAIRRWFVGRVTPFANTSPGCFVIAHEEITKRKLAEQKLEAALEKEVVLKREIHHRVKNNLQVVISLLFLQSARVTDPVAQEILRECQFRTRSIALIYALLSQSEDLTHIRFEEYARELATSLAATYRASTESLELVIEAAEMYVNVDTALPCGLIINELLSNSLKYAFPPAHPARVAITLRRPEPGKLELSVCDNGIGVPPGFSLDEVSTMGLTLVRDLVRQLNGTITIKADQGTAVWVSFPG